MVKVKYKQTRMTFILIWQALLLLQALLVVQQTILNAPINHLVLIACVLQVKICSM